MPFSEKDIRIENEKLKEQLKEEKKKLRKANVELSRHIVSQQALLEVQHSLNLVSDLDTKLQEITARCCDILRSGYACIFMRDNEENRFFFVKAVWPMKDVDYKNITMKSEDPLPLHMDKVNGTVLIQDMKAWPDLSKFIRMSFDFAPTSIMGARLSARDKHLGYLFIANEKGAIPFTEDDAVLFTGFANQAAAAIENVRLFDERLKEETEKARVRHIFQQYMAKQVVDELIKDPQKVKPGGRRQEVTILFSDIRGFTSMAETMDPEQLLKKLNEYFTVMIDVVFKYDGLLDKFIGDAIMAVFGAPVKHGDDAERAVRTAIEMQTALERLNNKWIEEGEQTFDIGIGLNTGPVVVGNIGDIRRMEYTVIGDNVNLAQRIENLTRRYRSSIIISQSTYEKTKNISSVREYKPVFVKGRVKPVRIYKLTGLKSDKRRRSDK